MQSLLKVILLIRVNSLDKKYCLREQIYSNSPKSSKMRFKNHLLKPGIYNIGEIRPEGVGEADIYRELKIGGDFPLLQ